MDRIKKLFSDDNKAKIYIIHLLMFIFYILFFYVIGESSYTADDLLNSNSLALKYIGKESVWQQTVRLGKEWLDAGRFFIFSDYVYFLFYYIPSRLMYKILIIISVYINSILFGKCVQKISKSYALGFLMMFSFPMCIQLTGEFDSALYAFHMLMQMVFLWTFLSLLLVMKYIDYRGSNKMLAVICHVMSGMSLFVALCTYEVAFVTVVFIGLGILAYTSDFKYTLKALIPDFIAYVIACVINLVLRTRVSDVGYSGISINLDLKAIVVTFVKQSLSVLPLNRFMYRTWRFGMPYTVNELMSNVRFTDIIMIFVYIIIFILLVKMIRSRLDKCCNYKLLIIGGMSLMIFPALLISITVRYQENLDWGTNHLSAYIQSFGLALVVACVLSLIIKLTNKTKCIVISVVLICFNSVILVTQETEARAFNNLISWNFRYAVENIEDAANSGIFDKLNSSDLIYGISDYYYDNAESNMFYSKYAKKDMPVKMKTDFETDVKMSKLNVANNNTYLINSFSKSEGSYVYVAHVCAADDTVSENTQKKAELYIDSIRIFTKYKNDFIIKYCTDDDNGFEIKLSDDNILKTTSKGSLYEIVGVNIPLSSMDVE